ncbi:MAG: hypothetical protein AAF202_09840, partial [Pseudomonadota bacterium]
LVKSNLETNEILTDDELVVYIRSLVKLGFFEEASRWVEKVNNKSLPELFDIQARMHISQWNYVEAIGPMQQYLESLDSESYSFLVARLNYCACLNGAKRFESSERVLSNTMQMAQSQGQPLIVANCLELLSQAYILSGRFLAGKDCIERSLSFLNQKKSVYRFYAERWRWAAELLQNGPSEKLKEVERKLREFAVEEGYWESVRDIDRLSAVSSFDTELLIHLYFGSVHAAYREQLLGEALSVTKLPHSYFWSLGGAHSSQQIISVDEQNELTPTVRKLFDCLKSDFYRPLPLGYLVSKLYPSEHFDPLTTPGRIHKNIGRLRTSLPEGLSVVWGLEGAYLISQREMRFRIEVLNPSRPALPDPFGELRDRLAGEWFTSSQVSQFLKLSQRTTQRLLSEKLEVCEIVKSGQGRGTRYKFAA